MMSTFITVMVGGVGMVGRRRNSSQGTEYHAMQYSYSNLNTVQ